MSSIQVPVATIDAVRPHPNADRLEVAEILGWQVVVGKGSFTEGDLVIYVPPDAVVPDEHAEAWGVKSYLKSGNRVGSIKLRGEPSFGFAVRPPFHCEAGQNAAEILGITKYEPPMKAFQGYAGPSPFAPDLEKFVRYTDIENLRHFPDLLREGEPVVVSEKIHGTNCRVGMIDGELQVGTRRRRLLAPDSPHYYQGNVYWWVAEQPDVQALLEDLAKVHRQVILFGEVFGPGVQSFGYGRQSRGFRAFDLLVDGRYLDYATFGYLMTMHGIAYVPLDWVGAYSLDQVKAAATWPTHLLGEGDTERPPHIREGVVVKPLLERWSPRIGRLVLKFVSDDYLTGNYDNGDQ